MQPRRVLDRYRPGWLIPVCIVVMIGVLASLGCSLAARSLDPTPSETPMSTGIPTADETVTPLPTDIPTGTPEPPTGTPEPAPDPFEPVTHNADWEPLIETINGIEMALVPAGCFQMGSEDGDGDEAPVHEVCFDEPFWIDVYEVTNAQYAEIAWGSDTFGYDCQSVSIEDDDPRICINWWMANEHCDLYRGARLPTEAEWEYAARGPDGLIYPWGNDFIADNLVYDGNSESRAWAVGSRPGGVSWVGAYDLSGNVSEWIGDWYASDYYRTLPDGVVNPQGPESGEFAVLRGGGWMSGNPLYLRAAKRFRDDPGLESIGLGFRCAMAFQP